MKLVLRDPPLLVLLIAIALRLPVRKVVPDRAVKPGWAARRLEQIIDRRDAACRRAS